MFQAIAVQGVIDALTGKNTPLVTKKDLNKKINNLHTTIDSIKQLIIDNAKVPSYPGRHTPKIKTAVSNLKDIQDWKMLDI